jgi:predicted deacylase
MQYVERDDVLLEPGNVTHSLIRLGELPNGTPYHVPVVAVSGRADGPTLVLHAGMHGDEVLGAACVREGVRRIDPTTLRGTVLAVPVANMAGMATRTRRNVIELYPGPHDMNRIYPGSSQGNMSERVAAYMLQSLLPRADYLLDMHNASVGGWWEPYATVPDPKDCPSEDVHRSAEALARAFGTGLVISGNKYHGSLVDAAAGAGVPCTMVEFGVANVIRPAEVDFGATGITNLLKYADMVDGDPEVPGDQETLTTLHRVLSNRGGFLKRAADVGQKVNEGDLIAEIEDLAGEVVETVSAPASGRVCRISTMGVVGTGDIVAYVGL